MSTANPKAARIPATTPLRGQNSDEHKIAINGPQGNHRTYELTSSNSIERDQGGWKIDNIQTKCQKKEISRTWGLRSLFSWPFDGTLSTADNTKWVYYYIKLPCSQSMNAKVVWWLLITIQTRPRCFQVMDNRFEWSDWLVKLGAAASRTPMKPSWKTFIGDFMARDSNPGMMYSLYYTYLSSWCSLRILGKSFRLLQLASWNSAMGNALRWLSSPGNSCWDFARNLSPYGFG